MKENDFQLSAPGWTHSALVQRAATWLRNRLHCRVVLTEQTTGSGEIPDAIGWKYLTESHLVEVKVSRADFFADKAKPFRCDPSLGMGTHRYFMAPSGVLKVEDLGANCDGWGLLEVKGRSVYVLREATPHAIHNQAEEIAQLVQALAQAQLRIEEPLHQWLTGPGSPVGQMREQQKLIREEMKTRTCSYYRLQTKEEETLHPDMPMAVSCPNFVAHGHFRCSDHGGKTRGERKARLKHAQSLATYLAPTSSEVAEQSL